MCMYVFMYVYVSFQTRRLPPPYGMCRERFTLKDGSSIQYHQENCLIDAMTKTIVQKCGCRDVEMVHNGK